jgi:hypothetical protein
VAPRFLQNVLACTLYIFAQPSRTESISRACVTTTTTAAAAAAATIQFNKVYDNRKKRHLQKYMDNQSVNDFTIHSNIIQFSLIKVQA